MAILNHVTLVHTRLFHKTAQRALACATMLTAGVLTQNALAITPMTLDSYYEGPATALSSSQNPVYSTTFTLPTVSNAASGAAPTIKYYSSLANGGSAFENIRNNATPIDFSTGPYSAGDHNVFTKNSTTIDYSNQDGSRTIPRDLYQVVTDNLGQVAIKTFHVTTPANLASSRFDDRFMKDSQCAPRQVTSGTYQIIPEYSGTPYTTLIHPSNAPLVNYTTTGGGSDGINFGAALLGGYTANGNVYTKTNHGTITWDSTRNDFTYTPAQTGTDDYFTFLVESIGTEYRSQIVAKSFYYRAPGALSSVAPLSAGHYVVPTGSGAVTISDPTALAGNVIVKTNGRDINITAAITQPADKSYGMTFVGGGTVTFSGNGNTASTYTGPTLYDLATTLVGIPASSAQCAKVRVAPGAQYTENGVISGEGSLVIDSTTAASASDTGGAVKLAAQNTYKGSTVVNNAKLMLGGDVLPTTTDALVVLAGSTTAQHNAILQADADVGTLAQSIHVLAEGVIDTNGHTTMGSATGSGTYKSVFGPGKLTITNTAANSGTYTLNGADAHTGDTVIDGNIKVVMGGASGANKFTDTSSLLLKSGELSVVGTMTGTRGLVLSRS